MAAKKRTSEQETDAGATTDGGDVSTTTAAKKPKEQKEVKLPVLKISRIKARIRGISPLVMHRFDEKAQNEIEGKQKGAAKRKELKDPNACFNAARYVHEGKDCFLAIHIKKAMMTAAADADMWKSEVARQVFVRGGLKGGEYVEIHESDPAMRRDWVRNRGRMGSVVDLRYRPEYCDWWAEIEIEYNASVITAEQILNLLSIAGFSCGIGENRPSKTGGDWGRFELDMNSVETEEKDKAAE